MADIIKKSAEWVEKIRQHRKELADILGDQVKEGGPLVDNPLARAIAYLDFEISCLDGASEMHKDYRRRN